MSHPAHALPTLETYCENLLIEEGECPQEICQLFVKRRPDGLVVAMKCGQRSCVEIAAESCPEEYCQLLDGCNEERVCYHLFEYTPPECGEVGYSGQDVGCCLGLVKRCGVEFFDGSCDMKGMYTAEAVPMCIPCGNGICNQFENRCNCPEDCG